MNVIGINQVHDLCLGIASEFAQICSAHKIPYYMLGGTMLGAIRHKGFIPWDDDMDFGVPREYYQLVQDVLQKELPSKYRCVNFRNHRSVNSAFFKIEDVSTVIVDPRIGDSVKDQLGVNIDIFPLDYCEAESKTVKRVLRLNRIKRLLYVRDPQKNVLKNAMKIFLRSICPVSKNWFLERQENILNKVKGGTILANVYGRWESREFVPSSWYGNKYYEFEGHQFRGIENYDAYLTSLYGNYMQLPPLDKQVAHINNVYFR